ncbi:HAMP domain-containing sensor histidine kinase [Aminipila luticellarii]|uniref:histidine kinase n=1 Tax=Aminipila luticellarii TaxID=2507160 RepID=A0A410PWN2_9FIRM|nr:HAMP domain-containing sensor histidine kinase [Aminipila luticellarii]QAT43353.1 HAMP domain-containing histidine kinase [Aminipila luticellarii]
MKKDKRKKGSFFSLLIKNYIAFTVVNVILVLSIFSLGTLALGAHLKMAKGDISSSVKLLEKGQYERVKPYTLVGPKGYFEILDKNNKVVYTSDQKRSRGVYTKGELECIQDYTGNVYRFCSRYKDPDDQPLVVVQSEHYEENHRRSDYFQIFDQNRDVVMASTNAPEKRHYTKREFTYLTNDLDDDLEISKYTFEGNDGKDYKLIMNMTFSDQRSLAAYSHGLIVIDIGIILCYILSIFGFVLWLSRKIKKPLYTLSNAMQAFADGDRNQEVKYKGSAEFVQICDSFNNMSEQLRESEQAKIKMEEQRQKMLADISHDLKTPITTIQGYAKALADEMIAPENQKKYLNKIYGKSVELTDLINTFYEYSKLEHPDFSFSLQPIEIYEFLREYLAGRYEEISDKGFELELDIPEKHALCKIDAPQLKRGFDNIVNNSIKHNPKGTKLFVHVSEEHDQTGKAAVQIIFADNGVGIPEDIALSIFDPFVVGDDSRNSAQGSGLGLSISKKIIEGHGGRITLERNQTREHKTVFKIWIPQEE